MRRIRAIADWIDPEPRAVRRSAGISGRFRGKFPGIDIELMLDGAAPLLDAVNDGRLDVVFIQPGEIGAAMTPQMLACESMGLIYAPDHPLARTKVRKLSALAPMRRLSISRRTGACDGSSTGRSPRAHPGVDR